MKILFKKHTANFIVHKHADQTQLCGGYPYTILKRYCKVHYCSDKMTEGIDHEVKPLFGT